MTAGGLTCRATRRGLRRVKAPVMADIALSLPAHDGNRRVTWLELFFDLVFVAVVAQIGERLVDHYTVQSLLPYALLLIVVWLAWSGYALFATRFDRNDTVQRVVTFAQMIAVIFMAA